MQKEFGKKESGVFEEKKKPNSNPKSNLMNSGDFAVAVADADAVDDVGLLLLVLVLYYYFHFFFFFAEVPRNKMPKREILSNLSTIGQVTTKFSNPVSHSFSD